MPSPSKPSSVKLPVAADFDQILNRVSMAVSKSQRLFSQAQRATGGPLAATAAPKPGAFSSLGPSQTTPSAPVTPAPTLASRYAYKTAAQHAAEDAEFESARNLLPNAGLGYAAPGAGGSAGDARLKREDEFALRRKLGLKGKNNAGMTQKRGRVDDSESEEDMGRSGVGRAKKARVQIDDGDDASRAQARKLENASAGGHDDVLREPDEVNESMEDSMVHASLAATKDGMKPCQDNKATQKKRKRKKKEGLGGRV